MFAQESVMDIQKEREAFKQHLTDTGLVEFSGYGFAVDECDEYLHEPTQVAWDSWLIGLNRAKAQVVPEGFVLVKKDLPEQIAEKMAIDRIDKPRHENDPVWREIAEQSYKDQVKSKKWEFWRDYKAMIEAQEPAND